LNNSSDPSLRGIQDRIFFRIPVNLPAKLILEDSNNIDVSIRDLSTTGLSFLVKPEVKVPTTFRLKFSFPYSFKKIEIEMTLRNESVSGNMTKKGCSFRDISSSDQKHIETFIFHFSECSTPWLAVNIASLFLFFDALFRFFSYTTVLYYKGTPFAKNTTLNALNPDYLIVLALYALLSLFAFIPRDSLNRKIFIFRIASLILVLGFYITKYTAFFKAGILTLSLPFITPFFIIQTTVIVFTLFALSISLGLLKRINIIQNSIDLHRHGFQQRTGEENPPSDTPPPAAIV